MVKTVFDVIFINKNFVEVKFVPQISYLPANGASLGSYFKAKNLNSDWNHILNMPIQWKIKV